MDMSWPDFLIFVYVLLNSRITGECQIRAETQPIKTKINHTTSRPMSVLNEATELPICPYQLLLDQLRRILLVMAKTGLYSKHSPGFAWHGFLHWNEYASEKSPPRPCQVSPHFISARELCAAWLWNATIAYNCGTEWRSVVRTNVFFSTAVRNLPRRITVGP